MVISKPLARFSGPTVTTRIWRLFAVACGALVILSATLMLILVRTQANREALTRTAVIARNLAALGEDLFKSESGQRGYLLTHDESYLTPYEAGIVSARARLDLLATLMSDRTERRNLEPIGAVVAEKLAELAQTVELERAGQHAAALRIVADGSGQRLMDRFNVLRTDTVGGQQRILDAQRARATRNIREIALILALGGGGTLCLLFVYTRRTSAKLGAPIHALVEAMLSVAAGSKDLRVTVVTRDEVGAMAAAFNTMAERLENGAAAQAAFVMELQISHEAMRKSEQALRLNERHLRTVVENIPAMICYIDRDERYQFMNSQYCEWQGLDPASVIGRTVREVHGEAVYADVAPIVKALLEGQSPDLGRHAERQVGSRLVTVSAVPQRSHQGDVVGYYAFHADISARRAAEQAVRESERRLTLVTDNFPGLISHIDCNLRYLMVNRRYADWLQVDPATMIGRSVREFCGETVFAGIERSLEMALSGATVTDEREIHFGGTVRHCQVALIPQRDSVGAIVGLFSIHTDITERRKAEFALRESQSFLARTGAIAGVGGWELDLADNRLTWSDETRRLHDVGPGFQPNVDDALRFYAEPSRMLIERAVNDCVLTGKPWDLELELISAKGRQFWARATGAAEVEHGRTLRLVGAFQDITDKRRLERELAESYELVRVTLESIGDAVITTDSQGRVQWLNPVAEAMTGWTKADARSRPLPEVCTIIHADSRQPGIDPIEVCLREGRTVGLEGHTTLVSREGVEYGIEDSASPIRNAKGQILGAVLVFHDVTEQRRVTREISHRAAHDALTGLVNRAEFETRLSRLLAGSTLEATAHVLMYIDLDQFKVVNDACGHSAGDQLLRQVSVLFQGCVRGRDTVARLGGDEFGVLLENCSIDQGRVIGQKICDQMESYRFVHDDRRYRIGASIGIVPVDVRWGGSAAVMQAADSCCYAAKDAGRNRVHLWVESDSALQVRQGEMQWVNRLEAALDENRFEVYAQHIEPMTGPGAGLHCEVLLRLHDDDGTLIQPGTFLPAAERFHLAPRIDRWVVHRVLEMLQSDDVRIDGIDTVAINLSGQSLGDRAFHRDLIRMLQDSRFDVRKLCLEITETAAITNLVDARSFIEEIRCLGVKIALDDFGAGASSFGYLRMLPVDYLKIDGQFITGLLRDPLANAAVRCFCDVARVIGVQTVAEFVERTDVRDALATLGVDWAQGYLIHRPERFNDLLPRQSVERSPRVPAERAG